MARKRYQTRPCCPRMIERKGSLGELARIDFRIFMRTMKHRHLPSVHFGVVNRMLEQVRIKMKIDKYLKAERAQKLNDEIQNKEVEVQKLEDEVRNKEDEVLEKEAKFRNQKSAAVRRLRAEKAADVQKPRVRNKKAAEKRKEKAAEIRKLKAEIRKTKIVIQKGKAEIQKHQAQVNKQKAEFDEYEVEFKYYKERLKTLEEEAKAHKNKAEEAEVWVKNMSRSADDETPTSVDTEGRPQRLGLGAKISRQTKVGPSNDPVERKLNAKLDAEKRKAAIIAKESTIIASDADDEDNKGESRTNTFTKRKAPAPLTRPIPGNKKQK